LSSACSAAGQAGIKHNEEKTDDTDDEDDVQLGDCGSEFRSGDKRILGSVVLMTRQTGADKDCDSYDPFNYFYFLKLTDYKLLNDNICDLCEKISC